MKQRQQNEKKLSRIRINVQHHSESEIQSAAVLMNGSRIELHKDLEQINWVAAGSLSGPLDFSLTALGHGSLHLRLSSGLQSILNKVIPFQNGVASLSIQGIPLLS